METKLIVTVSCLAAVSLAVFVYAIHHNKKNARRPSADEKSQRKFKRILADNSFKRILADNSHSPFVHFQHEREQNGDTTTVSHPYEDQIRFLLEHSTQPLKFSLASEPMSMERPYTWIDKRSELEALSQLLCLERVFAVDTEQHSLCSFLGFTALIQISTQEDDYLLGTIALHDDMCLLRSVFANPAICKDAATRSPCGDLSNPLLVLPLLPSTTNSGYQFEDKQAEADNDGELNNIVGAGYHAYEDSVLKKLQKVSPNKIISIKLQLQENMDFSKQDYKHKTTVSREHRRPFQCMFI